MTLSYDAVGNRTQVQDSLGGLTTSLYDAVHELTSRRFGGAGQTPLRIDLAYTARGQLAGETRYSDLAAGTQQVGFSSLSYDGAERLVHLQHQDGNGTNLANSTYSYDIASRLTAESLNGSTTTYNYDSTNQLTNDSNHSYSYDANGDRTMSGYQTGPNNQLLSDGTWNYSYDNEGNLIQKVNIATGEKWTYGYDLWNQMTTSQDATSGGSVLMQAAYVYDVFGNRIEKDVWTQAAGTTTVTRFAYDGANVWADLSGSSALQTRYLRGDVVDQHFWVSRSWDGRDPSGQPSCLER